MTGSSTLGAAVPRLEPSAAWPAPVRRAVGQDQAASAAPASRRDQAKQKEQKTNHETHLSSVVARCICGRLVVEAEHDGHGAERHPEPRAWPVRRIGSSMLGQRMLRVLGGQASDRVRELHADVLCCLSRPPQRNAANALARSRTDSAWPMSGRCRTPRGQLDEVGGALLQCVRLGPVARAVRVARRASRRRPASSLCRPCTASSRRRPGSPTGCRYRWPRRGTAAARGSTASWPR